MAEQPAQLQAGAGHIWCKYHCAGCDECFRSLAAFDYHRKGSFFKDTRHCADPAELESMEPLEGRCKLGNARGVFLSTVYRIRGSEESD